ncbi:MAG: LacI family DNA-binding transcriptional regulator [Lachnotalea sp.]
MAVTIKDIAKSAGVSYSTVSRALNGGENVKLEKKELIMKIAKEVGYIPNQAAINLKLSKAHTLGLFLSTISIKTSPYILHDVVSGIYSVVGSQYSVIVKGIDMQETNTLNPAIFDGLIILSQRTDDSFFIEEAMAKKIPLVVINRPVYYGVSNVLTDEAQGMKKAMEYLLDNGHRNIAVIESTQTLDSTRARHRGWVQAVEYCGLDSKSVPVAVGNYRFNSGYLAAKELLVNKPTAILCFNDEMAHGARKAILEAGLSIPDDVSLIGFDNLDASRFSDMNLTTIERNMLSIAKTGTEVLLKKIEKGDTSCERIYLDTQLIIRETVKDLRTGLVSK